MRGIGWPLVVCWLGWAAYLVLFFSSELPSLTEATGIEWRRVDLFQLLLVPEVLVENWLGPAGSWQLTDRLSIALAAAALATLALVVGWLLLDVLGVLVWLRRVERWVFAAATGFSAVSVYTLLLGLAGVVRNPLWFAILGAGSLATLSRRMRSRVWNKSAAEPPRDSRRVVEIPAVPTSAATGAAGHAAKGTSGAPRAIDRLRAGGRPRATEAQRATGTVHETGSVRATGSQRATGGYRATAADDGPALSPRWLWLAAPLVAVYLLGGVLPPVDFDVREYHLQAPKEFFLAGAIGFVPHNVYANMPLGAEMQALAAMVLLDDWWRGALAGKLLLALFAPLTAIGLWAAARRWLAPSAAVVAPLVYLGITWIVQVSCAGLIEGVLACYLLLSVYAALLWRDAVRRDAAAMDAAIDAAMDAAGPLDAGLPGEAARGAARPARLAALAGLMAGSALACKYPAAVFVVLPVAGWMALVPMSGQGRAASSPRAAPPGWPPRWRALAAFVLGVALASGGWLGKNLVLAGNPTYPLLGSIVGGRDWDDDQQARWAEAHRPPNFAAGDLVGRAADVAWRSEWLSPLVVPLVVLALVGRRRRPLVVLWAGYLLFVLAAWWLLTHRIDRFWIPALPIACLLAGEGAAWTSERAWRRTLSVLLVAGSAVALLWAVGGPGGYNRYFAPLAALRVDPERVAAPLRWLNENLRPGEAVLAVGDAQVFDLERPVYYNTVFDRSLLADAVLDRTADEARRWFEDRGIGYVYVHWGEIARYRAPGNYGFAEFVTPQLLAQLVADEVLQPPVVRFDESAAEIYPVAIDEPPPRIELHFDP